MAITKIFPIKERLDIRLSYVLNQEKTTGRLIHAEGEENRHLAQAAQIADSTISNPLSEKIDYALNRQKTESVLFEASLNCTSVETAFEDMRRTQLRYDKTEGRLGYHLIQSFAPGEVTAEEAHAIGIELAQKCVGDNYEVIIGTHLNKAHLHNHIVFNAVSFLDGKKYHLGRNGFAELRELSDGICREHGLSVIEQPKGKGQDYVQWQAEKQGKPTIRSQIRRDIDAIIKQSLDFTTFMRLLERKGYLIKYDRVKHMAIKPPYGKKYIRLDSLGDGYSIKAITEKIEHQMPSWQKPNIIPTQKKTKGKRYYKTTTTIQKLLTGKRRITGFAALYLRYVYLLRANQQGKVKGSVSRYLLEDTIRFQKITAHAHFLLQYHIATKEDLAQVQTQLEQQIVELTAHRKPLYQARRKTTDETEKEAISQSIHHDTALLRQYHKQLRIAQAIMKEADQKEAQIRQALKMRENQYSADKEQLSAQRRVKKQVQTQEKNHFLSGQRNPMQKQKRR